MNPIFIEYYSHEAEDCYKILLPWTAYREEKMVLCRVSEGLEKAKELAAKVIKDHLQHCLKAYEVKRN